jgi:hypothetical protein
MYSSGGDFSYFLGEIGLIVDRSVGKKKYFGRKGRASRLEARCDCITAEQLPIH